MKQNIGTWFEIYVENMERAKKFYETVFGVELNKLPMPNNFEGMHMLAFPMNNDAPGASGALVKMPGFGPGGSGTILYMSCEDCALEESRVVAAGGEVIKTKESIGEYGAISLIKDSEGNIVGLHSIK